MANPTDETNAQMRETNRFCQQHQACLAHSLSVRSLKGKGKGSQGACEASFSLAYGLVPKLPSPSLTYERLLVRLSSSWEVRRLSLTKVIKSREFDRGDSIHRLNLASLRSWQGQERLSDRERQQYAPRQRAPVLYAEETKVVALEKD